MGDEGRYPGATLPLFDGIMWVGLTDGRAGLNLLAKRDSSTLA
jgi:hypothetical protein